MIKIAPSSALTRFCPRNTSGRPVISSCNFPNATSEPQKLTDPITAEKRIPTRTSPASRPASGAWRWNSAAAMSAAAPPPTPLKSATICGIAVICTARAATTPTTEPSAIPTSISPYWSISLTRKVNPTAIAIPTAAIQLPDRAVRGCDSRFTPTMRRIAATR